MLRFLRLTIALSAITITGCHEVSTSMVPPPDFGTPPVEGLYLLRTLNGMARPVTIEQRPGFQLEIVDAVFSINTSPNFRSTITYRTTENGQVTSNTEPCAGSYSYGAGGLPKNAGTLLFAESPVPNTRCGRSYSGNWDGANTLTIDFDAATHSIYDK